MSRKVIGFYTDEEKRARPITAPSDKVKLDVPNISKVQKKVASQKIEDVEDWVESLEKKNFKVYKQDNSVWFNGKNYVANAIFGIDWDNKKYYLDRVEIYITFIPKEKFKQFLEDVKNELGLESTRQIQVIPRSQEKLEKMMNDVNFWYKMQKEEKPMKVMPWERKRWERIKNEK